MSEIQGIYIRGYQPQGQTVQQESIPAEERRYVVRDENGRYVAPETEDYEEPISLNEDLYAQLAHDEADSLGIQGEQYDAYVEMKTNSLILKELVTNEAQQLESLEDYPVIEPETQAQREAMEEAVEKAQTEAYNSGMEEAQAKSYIQMRANNAVVYQNMLDTDFSQFRPAIQENIKKYNLHVGGIYSNLEPKDIPEPKSDVETPVDSTPIDNTPVDNTPVDNTPAENVPANSTRTFEIPKPDKQALIEEYKKQGMSDTQAEAMADRTIKADEARRKAGLGEVPVDENGNGSIRDSKYIKDLKSEPLPPKDELINQYIANGMEEAQATELVERMYSAL